MTTEAISNYDDVIDSRAIIGRIEDLENFDDLDEDEETELRILKTLTEECSYSPNWDYGEALIRDTYFKEYAMELAEELDLLKPDVSWPYGCIDWDKAAEELQVDYISVDFDGVDYWIRS